MKRLEIWVDSDVESPREEVSDSKFYTWHRRYWSPDKHNIAEPMYEIPKDCIGIKVWMYDHSGHCYQAADQNPFHCPWDSGQVGWIFIGRADARKRLGVSRLHPKHISIIRNQLINEVNRFSEYVNGEVSGFTIYDEDGEVIESIGGFYNSDEKYMLECAAEYMK